jgi:hypothetical protein
MAITTARMKPAAYVRNIYAVTPEAGTTVDAIQEKEFWVHLAGNLHISDRLEVIPEDFAYYAELLVTEVGRTWAKVKLLNLHRLDSAEEVGLEPQHRVVWRGQKAKHSVVRISDNAVVKDGFDSKPTAVEYMNALETGAISG